MSDESTCLDQNHPGFGGWAQDCPKCFPPAVDGPTTGQLTRPSSRRRRAMVNTLGGGLYAVQWVVAHGVNIALVAACTAITGYWATAWLFLVLDRM